MNLTFRTLGAWGAGKGANLTPSEVDNNFWEIAQAIVDLTASPAVPVGIGSITVSGTEMTITLTDGTVMGPFTLPVLTFRWRGEWQPTTGYAELDVFTVLNTGIYMVQIAHTTGTTFDPELLIPPTTGSPAYLMLFGSADASLGSLPDVQLTALADQDFLHWVAADQKWENTALAAGYLAITAPQPQDTLVYNSASSKFENVRAKYVIGAYAPGVMIAASQNLLYHKFSKGVTLPANLGAYLGHTSEAGGAAAATASTVITLAKALAGTPTTFAAVASITFAAGAVTGTMSTQPAISFAQGDILRVRGPASPDGTFADFFMTLVGFET
jgi:hypothetical protein